MQKNIISGGTLIVALLLLGNGCQRGGAPVSANDIKNATYVIDGEQVTLVNGVSEMAIEGSESKKVTRYFGNEATGDLNGDGKDDMVLVLTQESGGSGTYFYAAAALKTDAGAQGTNAVLLGDRIAPQSTEIVDGTALVNFADRNPGEPFTTSPSRGVTKRLHVQDGKLSVPVPAELSAAEWKWVSTVLKDKSVVRPRTADAFTLTFGADGQLSGKTDCNSYFGQFEAAGGALTYTGPFGSTLMFCSDTQESLFTGQLMQADAYAVQTDGSLTLNLKDGAGTMTFKR